MKALVFSAQGKVEWKNLPKPIIGDFGAVIHPLLISPCSSDVHTVFGGSVPKTENQILGHECVGVITEVGKEVQDFAVGERVAIPAITPNWRATGIQDNNFRHAGAPFSGHQLGRTAPGVFAEYFSVADADTTLAHIPEGVTIEQALMSVDVVTTGFTGAEYADIKIGDTVCVMGIGPVGLMAVAGAKLLGAARIIAVGSRPRCAELAKGFGATDIINYKTGDVVKQVMQITSGIGVDSTIIAGGGDEAFEQAIDMTRYGIGTVSNINYYGGSGGLIFPKFSGGRGMAGKTIHTELAKGGRVRIERIMDMIRFGRVDPQDLITHRLSGLKNIEKALCMMKDKPDGLIKIAVDVK
ncbi:MAG: zinc-binding dehydrogenase [Christensenella sp.]